MTIRENVELFDRCRTTLKASQGADTSLSRLHLFAASVLNPRDEIDAGALKAALGTTIQGDNEVVLLSLACRRVGGTLWEQFRAQVMPVLGQQPLSGQVIILVNRLAQPQLPLVAAAP